MRTREKKLSDYNLNAEEAKAILNYCKSSSFDEHKLLIESAFSANNEIGSDLYYSIVRGISYEKLCKAKIVLISKSDFYGYRRKCLSIFKQELLGMGKDIIYCT